MEIDPSLLYLFGSTPLAFIKNPGTDEPTSANLDEQFWVRTFASWRQTGVQARAGFPFFMVSPTTIKSL
jgi:hypothetical protein